MASRLETVSKNSLDVQYLTAKMTATPLDYTISSRVMVYTNLDDFDKFNIFKKNYNTEAELWRALDLEMDDTHIPELRKECNVISEDGKNYMNNIVDGDNYPFFVDWNHLRVNEQDLIRLVGNGLSIHDPNVCAKTIYDEYLLALETWHLCVNQKDSLIPNLFYLGTEYHNMSLEDLDDIKFARDLLSKKIACCLPNNSIPVDYGNPVESFFYFSDMYIPSGNKSLNKDVEYHFRLGFMYSLIYGFELMYYFKDLSDVLKEQITKLLKINYEDSSLLARYLFKIDSSIDEIVIDSRLSACFDTNNIQRFTYYKAYLEDILRDSDISKEIWCNPALFSIPNIFGRMVLGAHHHAYKMNRLKLITLYYTEARNTGVLNQAGEEAASFAEAFADLGSMLGGGTSLDEEDNSLGSLIPDFSKASSLSKSDDGPAVADYSEKNISLDIMDALKKDLDKSMYEFDIQYVKPDDGYKAAYMQVVENTRMIAHNLVRQIKEIKTYNVGGKNNGLTTGKLDKKNLHKYKHDQRIFYNNTYKVKEMDLAFGCILDESGSMSGSKVANGRIVMVLLHTVLNSLGINHSIIGHSGHYNHQSDIYKYYQFKEEKGYTLRTPYHIMSADARSCNCDSGALYYMESVMKHVRNKDKIVIIFSDGQPTECTDAELRDQVKRMEKHGIHVIGVGINFESIKEYYPDNANGRNLQEMVDIVVKILKRYVLEKED